MIAAIETSKHIHVAVLTALWGCNDANRMTLMLHGLCMLTNMDADEPEAYAELLWLREFASGHPIDLEGWK